MNWEMIEIRLKLKLGENYKIEVDPEEIYMALIDVIWELTKDKKYGR